MKEYIKKFSNPAAADQYAIKDIPFITSVDGDPIQNLHCNLSGKKLVNESGYVYICGEYEFVGNGNWSTASNWKDNIVPSEIYKNNIIVKGNMTISSVVCAHNFTIDSGYTVEIQDGGVLCIDGVSETQEEYGNIDAKEGGKLVIKQTGSLEVNNLIINALMETTDSILGNSCEIFGAERILINGDCYFDLRLEPKTYLTTRWYEFCVPFEVNQSDGIYGYNGSEWIHYVYNTHYALADYNTNHNKAYYTQPTLYPGNSYKITLNDNYGLYRFVWNKNGTIYGNTTYELDTLIGSGYKIKGIGNSTLFKARIDNTNDINEAETYNTGSNKYTFISIDSVIPIGTAVFWVTDENAQSKTITWVPENDLLNS